MKMRLTVIALLATSTLLFADDPVPETTEESPGYWERAKEAYEELTSGDRNLSEETKEWIKEDIERIGDWEYKVVELELTKPETIEAELNQFGEERWECFFITQSEERLTLMFKRPKISYLREASKFDWSKLLGNSGN